MRDIGERAGVDAALIARYFGGKEPLYLATLEQKGRATLPADPTQVLERMLSRTEQRGSGPVPLAMVSPTLTDDMREQVRAIMGRCVVEPLAERHAERGAGDPQLRAELLVAIAIGVSLTRASGTLPALANASLGDVLAVLEAPIAALDGDGTNSGPGRPSQGVSPGT